MHVFMKEKILYKPNYDGDITNSIACFYCCCFWCNHFPKDKQIEMVEDIKLFWLREIIKFLSFNGSFSFTRKISFTNSGFKMFQNTKFSLLSPSTDWSIDVWMLPFFLIITPTMDKQKWQCPKNKMHNFAFISYVFIYAFLLITIIIIMTWGVLVKFYVNLFIYFFQGEGRGLFGNC